jgi:hypothetical protein
MISRKGLSAIFWILAASIFGRHSMLISKILNWSSRRLKTTISSTGRPWTSDESEFDYDMLKTDIYEALLNGRRAKTKEPEIYLGENEAVERDRAVINFTFDWLRCILR